MATPTLSKAKQLKQSLHQLEEIAEKSYNVGIREIAIKVWRKHLLAKNPQWKYVEFKAIPLITAEGQAHVMAMYDKRLPNIGLVGYFACTDAETGAAVLRAASAYLKVTYGVQDIFGPIKGTLPNDYRLNLADNYEFPGEPVNPGWSIDAFEEAGFTVFNRYASARLKHFQPILALSIRPPKNVPKNISIRAFDDRHYDRDFKTYHDLRNKIFPLQSVYCPSISLAERKYNLSGKFDSELTFFLQDKKETVGFVMGYLHNNQLVLKTIGVLPEYQGRGYSKLLVRKVHDEAYARGARTAIYAMVREGNKVHRNKHPLARIVRRYVTMHRTI